jgi:hypothetical protein
LTVYVDDESSVAERRQAVCGLNDIGDQLCAPKGPGKIVTGSRRKTRAGE